MAFHNISIERKRKALEKLTQLMVRTGSNPYDNSRHWQSYARAVTRQADIIPFGTAQANTAFDSNHSK